MLREQQNEGENIKYSNSANVAQGPACTQNVNQESQFFDSSRFALAVASERRVVTQCGTIITLQC